MLEIRAVTPADAELICQVVRASFEDLRPRLSPPSSAHDIIPPTVVDNLRTSNGFLALWFREPAGCVFCRVDEDSMYLFRLGVLPKFRGKGIARALVGRVEEEARLAGEASVTLATRSVLHDNIALYRRYGFMVEAEVPHPRAPEARITVMRKELGPSVLR